MQQILKNVAAKYVYGLTATPIRQDGHHPIIFMLTERTAHVEILANALKEKLPNVITLTGRMS